MQNIDIILTYREFSGLKGRTSKVEVALVPWWHCRAWPCHFFSCPSSARWSRRGAAGFAPRRHRPACCLWRGSRPVHVAGPPPSPKRQGKVGLEKCSDRAGDFISFHPDHDIDTIGPVQRALAARTARPRRAIRVGAAVNVATRVLTLRIRKTWYRRGLKLKGKKILNPRSRSRSRSS